VHLFTLYWYVRPYGVGTLLGVYDKTGPQLYHVEPSGIAYVRPRPLPPHALWTVSKPKTPSSGTRTTEPDKLVLGDALSSDTSGAQGLPGPAGVHPRHVSHVAESSGRRGRVVGVSQRYFGTAVGKGRQAAKTEIERLKLEEMTAREAVKQVAKMCVQPPRCEGKAVP